MGKPWKRRIKQMLDELGGGTIEPTGSGHLKIRLTIGGGPVYVGSTPSDKRSVDNFRAMLRRVHRLAQSQKPMIR